MINGVASVNVTLIFCISVFLLSFFCTIGAQDLPNLAAPDRALPNRAEPSLAPANFFTTAHRDTSGLRRAVRDVMRLG
jgi:hypothetical protein